MPINKKLNHTKTKCCYIVAILTLLVIFVVGAKISMGENEDDLKNTEENHLLNFA